MEFLRERLLPMVKPGEGSILLSRNIGETLNRDSDRSGVSPGAHSDLYEAHLLHKTMIEQFAFLVGYVARHVVAFAGSSPLGRTCMLNETESRELNRLPPAG